MPELARQCGVSASQLRNWASQASSPLQPVETTNGHRLHTWAQLRAFCTTHPHLPAVRKLERRLAADASKGGGVAAPPHPEVVRTVLSNLRAAAASNLSTAITAARLAEATARSHREQLEALASTINAYDDLLTQLTAPVTPYG